MSINLKKNEIDLKNKWEKFMKTKEENSWYNILVLSRVRRYKFLDIKKSDNGIQQLVESLMDNQMMYGAIFMKDESMSLPKIIFIFWVKAY
ncbi:hypothetical protein MXB_1424 [Myxobolus squamalis]|nr:hypothetical protein MXB_1424 [Myxobolus squamalis]